MPLLQFLSLNGPVPNALNDFQSKFLNDHLKGLELEYKIGEIARIMKVY